MLPFLKVIQKRLSNSGAAPTEKADVERERTGIKPWPVGRPQLIPVL